MLIYAISIVLLQCQVGQRWRPFSSSGPQYAVLEHFPSETKSVAHDSNPIVVLYGWLLAKSKHLEKFGNLYNKHGADVVTVKPNVAEVIT